MYASTTARVPSVSSLNKRDQTTSNRLPWTLLVADLRATRLRRSPATASSTALVPPRRSTSIMSGRGLHH